MDLSRLDRGLQIAGGAGILLFISLFLPWYSGKASFGGFSASSNATAWQAFSYTDLLLFIVAAIAIAAAVLTAMGNVPAALPVPLSRIVLGAGAVGVVIILFRLIDLPTPDIKGPGVDFGRKIGIFIGLIAAGGIAYAGTLLEKGATYTPPVR